MAAAVSLSLPVEGATFQVGGQGGLRLEQAIRRGRAGGRTPGEPKAGSACQVQSHTRARAPPLFVHSALLA